MVQSCENIAPNESFVTRTVNPAMQELEQVIADVAPTDIPVLLIGESGTGKGALAARIHQLSARHDEPFVKMSCALLTTVSFQEELHNTGRDQAANRGPNRGTVFLDEIGELDPSCQRQLLSMLPDGNQLQGRHWLASRVISATTRSLEDERRNGRLREELYYRINGISLRLPPLRERKEDIPILVDYFLTKYSALFARPRLSLSPETLSHLADYPWPGNIRELENLMKKMVAVGHLEIPIADPIAPASRQQVPSAPAVGCSLKATARAASRQAERELISKVLKNTRWNRRRAAQELQISYKALLYKLKQLCVDGSADC